MQWESFNNFPAAVAIRDIAQCPFILLKELWISFCGRGVRTAFDFPALELLVIGQELDFVGELADMLGPGEGVVPSPRIATIEIRGYVRMEDIAEVLRARAKAGC